MVDQLQSGQERVADVALMPRRGLLAQVFWDVATSAPVIFSTGNLIWSDVTAQGWSVGLNAAVLVAATATQIYDSISGKKTGIPFYVTSAVNGLTALSTVARGISHLGLSELFHVASDPLARRYVFSAVAFAGWSAAHFIMGYRSKHGRDPAGIGSQQIHAGYADIFMTAADTAKAVNPVALGFVIAGLAKAIFGRKVGGDVVGAKEFFNRHLTPNRLYAACFLSAAGMAMAHPAYAAAQALWGYGYTLLDPKENREFGNDAAQILGRNVPPPAPGQG